MLVGIFVLAFVLRLGYALIEDIPLYVDARIYHMIALNLMEGQGFALSPEVPRQLDGSIRVVGPAYPVFLGGLYWLFGPRIGVVWLVQALLGAATCVVLAYLGRDAFGWNAGVAAAGMAAVAFDLVIFPGMLLTETLYLFLTAIALLALSRALSAESEWWPLVSGVLVGVAALTRPTLLLFAILIAGWQILRRSWRRVVPFILGIALLLMPWGVRNYRIYGQFILVSPNGGWNFWLGANPEADGSYPNVTPPEILHALRTVPYLELSRLGYTRGMEFIRDHPGQYAKILALKLTKTFSAARTNGWYLHMRGTDRIVSIALSALTTLVLLPLAILGLFRSMQRRNPTWVLLALYAGSCLLSGLIYTVHARYRLLMFPAVIVFAAQGLHELWRARHLAKEEIPMAPLRASLGLAVGIVAVATTADVLTTASEVQRRIALLLGL